MTDAFVARASKATLPIHTVTRESFSLWRSKASKRQADWVAASGFRGAAGKFVLIPGDKGTPEAVLAGVSGDASPWDCAALSATLPKGTYRFADEGDKALATRMALGWALGKYAFKRYRSNATENHDNDARLVRPKASDRSVVERTAVATFLARDLINTPASHMGPVELAAAAKKLADAYKAKIKITVGGALLKSNYPMIHAVGRASSRPPRLIDITWGRTNAPKVTLVGKGVCFDTGGLDIKPAGGMLQMKKDMAGGATVLGLASMIMDAKLDVRLRVLIPAVENSVSGNAYRPQDVLTSRKGITVEVGDTDAEGRLVLADALWEASSEAPDLLMDFATLTGAQRVACGTELPSFFCHDDKLAGDFYEAGEITGDPVWRLPLFEAYRSELDSPVADICSVGKSRTGGAIHAALFLEEFVSPNIPWIHMDFMGWTVSGKPGKPSGGEPQSMRAVYALIEKRFGKKKNG